MKLDTYVDRRIEQDFVKKNEEESKEHISSGKLSAGQLANPLQWQILKILKVEPRPFEEYTLRKFKRGKDIEAWLIKAMPDVVEEQKFVEYKNCVGYIDVLCDSKNWDFKMGVIPVEIKSVANAKYKRILQNGADRGHILQAGLYALAEKTEHFAVVYVASDDLRICNYIYDTADYKNEIDGIIERFDKQIEEGGVPMFVPNEVWQKNVKYNRFPEWAELSQEQIDEKVNQLKL